MKTITSCRICRSDRLRQWLDLGATPLVNAFLTEAELAKPEPCYPLRVLFCEDCGLSQLGEVVDPATLFSREYVYLTSAMPRVPEHFRNYANEAVDCFAKPNGLVVEIGSNDGILLMAVKERGMRVLGVDPAWNVAEIANQRGVPTIAEFFSETLAREIASRHGLADVVIANNVVAHIDDHHDLIRGIKTVLGEEGVFIFEAPYILDMFERLAFDSIYHEHLSYLSLPPLTRLLGGYSMEIFDAKIFPVQGKSIRVYAGNAGRHPVKPSVDALLAGEETLKLGELETYRALAARIGDLKREVVATLQTLKAEGKRVAAYGAPARGNTILNYYGLGRTVLDHATEELATKIGRYTPGSRLPVIHVEESRKNPPDYYLLLAWNYLEAITEKERNFRERGGKFIMPVGTVRVV